MYPLTDSQERQGAIGCRFSNEGWAAVKNRPQKPVVEFGWQ